MVKENIYIKIMLYMRVHGLKVFNKVKEPLNKDMIK